jgi:hypothetical protein
MTEEASNSVTERMTRLEANLDRFIDFVSQNQRNQQLQLQTQQAQIDALNRLCCMNNLGTSCSTPEI